MAKKLKEDINLDEIDENFIISSVKTGGKASATDTSKEKVTDKGEPGNRKREKNGDCRSTVKSS